MKTDFPSKNGIVRQWHVIDAENVVLGKLASHAAKILMGKHKASFTPFLDTGDHVIVVNASKVVMTGNKLLDKHMYRHSGYPGGLTAVPYSKIMATKPEMAIEKAIKGMLPSNKLGNAMLKKLRVYAGPAHPHSAQNPKTLDLKEVAAPHNPEQAHTIEEVTGA
jgi:large subunit ribosomal protein L13